MSLSSKRARQMGKKSSRKGIKNKTTQEIRELFKTLLEENMETLREDLKDLEPQQRARIMLEIAKFVIPTLKSTELSTDENGGFVPLQITGMIIK